MKKITILSIIVAAFMLISVLAGCSNNSGGEKDLDNPIVFSSFPSKLSAEKLTTAEGNGVTLAEGGFYYRDDSKMYTISSYDGKSNTGAKYTHCSEELNYFCVSTSATEVDVNNINTINNYGLVDTTGKVLVPEEYADIDVLSSRFAKATKVTEITDSEDEALIFYTDRGFALTPSEGDTLFKGIWYIYDLTTGKKIEGVSGSGKYYAYAYGNYIKYTSDAGEYVIVNAEGKALPEGADLFDNGYYTLESDTGITLYDTNDKIIKTFTESEFAPVDGDGEYLIASKVVDYDTTYVVMDTSGKIISSEFSSRPYFYGELVLSDSVLYDVSGKKVIDGTYDSVYFDDALDNAWILKNDSDITMIKKDGTVIYSAPKSDDLYFDTSNFLIDKDIDGKNMFYSLKDNDFTIEGYSIAPWLVRVENPASGYDLVDVISGETVLNAYEEYSSIVAADGYIYISAKSSDGKIDIYRIK